MNRFILYGCKQIFTIIFCLAIILNGLSSFSQTHRARFRHLTAKEGFTSAAVWTIYKDSKGFIWFGTADGLYRYDGYQFKAYKNEPSDPFSISGNSINKIFEDQDGILWFGSNELGLNRYDRARDHFKRYYPNPDTSSLLVNGILCIYQDKTGTLWFSTPTGGLHQYVDSTDNFISYRYDTINPVNYKNFIKCIYEDSQGNLWTGMWEGIYIFDRKEKKYHEPEFLTKVEGIYRFYDRDEFISFKDIFGGNDDFRKYRYNSIIEDTNGIIWFATNGGLLKYDPEQVRLSIYERQLGNPVSLSDITIRDIIDNPFNDYRSLWISTGWGLNNFDKATGLCVQYFHDPVNPQSLAYSNIFGMYLDDDGLLWIGNEFGGLSILNVMNTHYEYYQIDPTPEEDQLHTATTFYKDQYGYTWVGTETGGLFRYDQEMNLIDHYSFYLSDIFCRWCNFIYSINETNDGHLWVGTLCNGLYLFNRSKNDFTHCKLIRDGSVLQYEKINAVFKDSFGWQWVGTSVPTGLFYQKPGNRIRTEFHPINQDPLEHIEIRSFYEDEDSTLWIATSGEGIYLLRPESRDSLFFEKLKPKADIGAMLNSILAIYCDYQNNLWFGGSHGLTRYSTLDGSIANFNSSNGLNADLIYDIEGDQQYLWLSSDKGLLRFDPKESGEKKVKIMQLSDGVPFDDIYTWDIYKSEDGMIYVGGKRGSGDGFYRFHPSNIRENKQIPPIVITGFQVKNKPIQLDSNITEKRRFLLKHNENYFSFEFAALDYVNPERNLYAYKLEGVDEDWVQSGTRRFVNYTGISPGSYTFRVKGSNNDGVWNEEGISMAIIVLPPPWKTWWAYTLYAIAFGALLLALRSYDLKRQRLKQNLELEKVEKDKLGELDKMKSRFFANISHEFRTPLTLILGPLGNLEKEAPSEKSKKEFNIIQRNALRLQQLINQLLSLSKLESGQMKLQAQELNIVQLVRGYTQSFESLAMQKKIKLDFKSDEDKIMVWADQDKVEKILYNLLSNAFKFTDASGSISVNVGYRIPDAGYKIQDAGYRMQDSDHRSQITGHKHHKGVVISVSDTGSGIDADRLPHIFDRFYQVDDTYKSDAEGTGIGLALTKELVELHQGTISVSSERGAGSRFEVFLPLGEAHLKSEERGEKWSEAKPRDIPPGAGRKLSTVNWNEAGPSDIPPEAGQQLATDSDKPILLIVEDNSDLRTYIRGQLEDAYNIIEAKDGEQGLARAIEHVPDLVISDVMMPKMDGFELCSELKTDERTSHIPVILLTARASSESKIEGLETGADDFITKPFDPQELLVRINNLINLRRRLREDLIKDLSKPGFPRFENATSSINSADQEFIKKATLIVENHLDDQEFTIESFGKEMALSRVQLHRKLRALLDYNTSEFIRGIRLSKAAQMLLEKQGNIAQIAYEVGFNNLSYFSKCFQEMYGKSPSDYGKM